MTHQLLGCTPVKVEQNASNQSSTFEPESSKPLSADGRIPRGFGKLIRDSSGAIVDVILEEEESRGGVETAVRDRGTEVFEIEGPVGEPESTNSAATSNWLLEGPSIEEDARGVVDGTCPKQAIFRGTLVFRD